MTADNCNRLAPNPYSKDAEQALADLVNFRAPIDQTLDTVKARYDNGPRRGPAVVLTRFHLRFVLEHWRTGEITGAQLREWTQALDRHHRTLVKRPYLGYEPGYATAIAEVLIRLAGERELPYAGALIDQLERRLQRPDAEPRRRWLPLRVFGRRLFPGRRRR